MSQLRAAAGVARRGASAAADAAATRRHSTPLSLSLRLRLRCCALHSRSDARVAAVFGGDDAFSSPAPSQPAAAAAAAAASSSSASKATSAAAPRPSVLLRGLSSLFAGLPPTAATASASPSVATPHPLNPPAFVLPQPRAAPSTAAAPVASFAPPVHASEAASAAQTAITYITPQFLVYVRANSSAANPEEDPHGDAAAAVEELPLTPQSILQRSYEAGLGWSDEQGIAARHIMIVSATESGLDFSTLAGFECHEAFYLTFPRHETRSAGRVKFLQYGLVGARSSMARKMDSELGWRMVRYPAQLLLRGVPIAPPPAASAAAKGASKLPFGGIGGMGGMANSGSSKDDNKLDPRALLAMARTAGLAGWDVLDESFFESWRPTSVGGGVFSAKGLQKFDYTIRVPPLAKYMRAVADIAQSSEIVHAKLGWTVQPAPRLEGDVPMHAGEQGIGIVPILPTKSVQRTTNPAAATTTPAQLAEAAQAQQALMAAAITANIVVPTTTTTAATTAAPSPSAAALPPIDTAAFSTNAVTPAVFDTPLPFAGSSPSFSLPATNTATPAAPLDPETPDAPVAPRCYFYRVDDHGRFFLEGGVASGGGGGGARPSSELADRSALRMMLRALRRSEELLNKDANLRARSHLPVEIPVGCALWGQAQRASSAAATMPPAAALFPSSSSSLPSSSASPSAQPLNTLPLSVIPTEYPWVASCAGELNFIRCQVVPVVFRALKIDRKAHKHVLQYGAELTTPFKPAELLVDEEGRLFHPAPPLLPISAAATAAASSSSLPPPPASATPVPNPLNLGLLRSHLALELDLQESPFTAAEERLNHHQAVEERRLQIEAHEEYQRRVERGEKFSQRADVWIAVKVKQTLDRSHVRHLSNFVCVWEGQSYRIGQLDHKVAPTEFAAAAASPSAPTAAASPRRPVAR